MTRQAGRQGRRYIYSYVYVSDSGLARVSSPVISSFFFGKQERNISDLKEKQRWVKVHFYPFFTGKKTNEFPFCPDKAGRE